MTWGSELAVDAGGRELAEKVLVQIAFCVGLSEWQRVDHVHGRDQESGLLNQQLRILHVLGKAGALKRDLPKVREHAIAHQF